MSAFADTDSIPFNGTIRPVTPEPDTEVLTTLIPHSLTQPPECTWQPVRETPDPTLLTRTHGAGRMVYFPSDVDRQIWKGNFPDMIRTVRSAIRWALRGPQTVEVEGPGLVDLQPYQAPDTYIVHLVNLNQAGFWKAPVDEIVPLPSQLVRIRLPHDRKVVSARLLVSEQGAVATQVGDIATVKIDSIDGAHEVIVLHLEA